MIESESTLNAFPAKSPEARVASQPTPASTEDSVLALLQRTNLAPDVIEGIAKNASATKSRKVMLALAAHPRTPRHVSLPLLRHLFTFELMTLALAPAAPPEVRRAAEEALMRHLETISSGEKLTLAHRASGRVAEALLLDAESRVMQAALENSRLTEASIVAAVLNRDASAEFIHAVSAHPKWSLRREVRIALLRTEYTPLSAAVAFVRALPSALVKEILQASRLSESVKAELLNGVHGHD